MNTETDQSTGDRRSAESEMEPQTLLSETLSFSELLTLLLRGKQTVLLYGLVGLVLSAILAFALAPTYTATTSFVPPGSNNAPSSAALMSQLSALGGSTLLGGKSQGDLYVGILKSHTIARSLVEHYNLEQVYKVKKESLAEKKLGQKSLFESDAKDPIVTISVTDGSPVRARDLANGYLKALQETSAQLALSESSQRRLFFEQRLAKEKNDLSDAEVALKQVEEHTGLIAPGGQTTSQIQTLAQLNGQITTRQAQLAALRTDEAEENPDVIRMHSEISSLEAQVRQLQVGSSKDQLGRLSTAQVPALELDYVRRARDVKYHETLFEIIAKQYEAARLDEAKDSPLQVLDHATIPDTKSGPHRAIIIAIGLLLGLISGAVKLLVQHSNRPQLRAR